jgi:hypothetical protein
MALSSFALNSLWHRNSLSFGEREKNSTLHDSSTNEQEILLLVFASVCIGQEKLAFNTLTVEIFCYKNCESFIEIIS